MCSLCKCDGIKWKYFFRQLLIISGSWSSLFMLGLNVGAPTVLVPQLRHEANSTDAVTPEQASWLPVVFSYSSIPWVILLPVMAALYGRKITHLTVCISSMIGYIGFYCSHGVIPILISEVFQGLLMASFMTIAIFVITEYSSSDHRGLFLTIKAATFYWGILAANILGTFFHWKTIPLLGILCSIYNLISVYFWPESPLWLAKKGRFDKCAESHRWLKGFDRYSERELEKLIANNQKSEKKLPLKYQVASTVKVITKIQFYKPVLLCSLLGLLRLFSGKLVCTIYALDILKAITNDSTTAYAGMLILDGITVFSMYVGCALTKLFKRRPLLLTFTAISVLFLFTLSLYLYLIKWAVIFENKYVSISLLAGFSISIALGPLMSGAIIGELIPMESRSFSLCAIAVIFKITYSAFIKVSPYVFRYVGMHGTFLLFAVCSTVCFVLIYYYLPETKDKTLQEIADCISGVKPVEEAKELLPVMKNNVTIVPINTFKE